MTWVSKKKTIVNEQSIGLIASDAQPTCGLMCLAAYFFLLVQRNLTNINICFWDSLKIYLCHYLLLSPCPENHSMQGLDSNCFCICGISCTCVPSSPSYLMWTSMPLSSRWRSQWYYCLSGCWSPHLFPWAGGLLPYRWKALIGGQGPWTVPISSSPYRLQGSGYSVSLTGGLYQ